jgi:hypothetical protein
MNRLVKLFKPYLVFLTIIVLFAIPVFGGCSSSPRSTSILTTTTAKPESDVVVAWEKTYGSPGDDMGTYAYPTSDGGYIVVGATSSSAAEADRDVWLLKLDENGGIVWEKTFGGQREDVGFTVLPTSDGGYIINGLTNSSVDVDNSIWLIWVIKTDSEGNKVWDKTISGTKSAIGNSMVPVPGGGYVISGATGLDFSKSSDGLAVKINDQGDIVWSQTYGGDDFDHIWSFTPISDAGYIGIGGTDSFGHGDLWLIKIDGGGKELWNKAYEGQGDDYGFAVMLANDGGYVLAGTGSPNSAKKDLWLIKTDIQGNIVWENIFSGAEDDDLNAAHQTLDGGYILTGTTSSFGAGGKDAWLVRTDGTGNKLWDITIGGVGDDFATTSVYKTGDGGYIFTGYSNSSGAGGNDLWVVKLTPVYSQ